MRNKRGPRTEPSGIRDSISEIQKFVFVCGILLGKTCFYGKYLYSSAYFNTIQQNFCYLLVCIKNVFNLF